MLVRVRWGGLLGPGPLAGEAGPGDQQAAWRSEQEGCGERLLLDPGTASACFSAWPGVWAGRRVEGFANVDLTHPLLVQ